VTDARGFSLVEVAVAVLILGVALVPLVQLFPAVIADDAANEATLQLDAAAERQMELLVAQATGNPAAPGSGTAACPDAPGCLLTWTVTPELTSRAPGVGVLLDLSVTACADTNRNGVCEAGEPQVRYDAKATSRP
jgi:prepilin-type N-terminal cleavage/methylation domain-containing protein